MLLNRRKGSCPRRLVKCPREETRRPKAQQRLLWSRCPLRAQAAGPAPPARGRCRHVVRDTPRAGLSSEPAGGTPDVPRLGLQVPSAAARRRWSRQGGYEGALWMGSRRGRAGRSRTGGAAGSCRPPGSPALAVRWPGGRGTRRAGP